jgi:hypothetical protein
MVTAKPFEFRVGQKFEGKWTGSIREITVVDGRTVDYVIHYQDHRDTPMYGITKRMMRDMLRSGEIKEVA